MGWSIGTGIGPLRYSIPLGGSGKHRMRRGARGATAFFTGVLVIGAQLGMAALMMVWVAILMVAWLVKRLMVR